MAQRLDRVHARSTAGGMSGSTAIVTDAGGLLSHSAIVAREYGIPGVVGTRNATDLIPDGTRAYFGCCAFHNVTAARVFSTCLSGLSAEYI